jgi:hypothetical protein
VHLTVEYQWTIERDIRLAYTMTEKIYCIAVQEVGRGILYTRSWDPR